MHKPPPAPHTPQTITIHNITLYFSLSLKVTLKTLQSPTPYTLSLSLFITVSLSDFKGLHHLFMDLDVRLEIESMLITIQPNHDLMSYLCKVSIHPFIHTKFYGFK